jgi:hypothetical protein
LSEGRLIYLVVTIESKADHVNEDILLKLGPVRYHQLAHTDHSLWVASIDSKNGHSEWFDNISRVGKTAVVFRISGKAYLVICNYVQGTVT